ncbi:LytR/AlgR family response regulator transcription factor [Maribacter hydrothermalis]|uniref:DNA-binding response regulator n=1 Tax=Maribacter hydrothermalis TaxID=1836467 RepID=A0A1B7ZBU7_9FLAO|nr:response regulator [Maribacter hydrothermalis]APQ15981.1 DNA-binding response regulator [Maribacter hydrothermalis]OBR40398.1 DNA-binding response regulator [Maribacter hydrothermalis]
MENNPVRILIVEDDMIIGANLSIQLTSLGYEVTAIIPRGEEAIMHIREQSPHILLMDINLKGSLNGIETVKIIQKAKDIPIIYLTANSDDATFEKAKETQPKAFITKPFNKVSLQRTIALVVEQLKESKETIDNEQQIEVLDDRIFVRHNGRMEKLLLDDILYIEADRNYCTLITQKVNHILTCTLKVMQEKLPSTSFVRVHRSYIINISKLDVLADGHLEIGRKVIPIGKSHKGLLLNRIRTI